MDKPMRIAITGSNGFIGSALVPYLKSQGHEVVRLVRAKPEPDSADVYWNPASGEIDAAKLEGIEAVVHLAGENVGGRWTGAKKARIRDSRIMGTRLLSETLAGLTPLPKVLIAISAIGYYGSRGAELLNETNPPGDGFLASVCREWEAAAEPASNKGIRVVNLRTAVVLSDKGGLLERLIRLFRMYLGGRVGNGRQFMSWITLADHIAAIHHALITASLHGPVNSSSPNPVTNREFTRILGRVLARPTVFTAPAFVLRLVFGQMADEAMLASARVIPTRLLETGFTFGYPELEAALRHLIREE